jgi:hypothetical protein
MLVEALPGRRQIRAFDEFPSVINATVRERSRASKVDSNSSLSSDIGFAFRHRFAIKEAFAKVHQTDEKDY